MKKITLLAAIFAVFAMNAQTTLLEDDFESYDNFIISDIGEWTLADLDGLPTYGFTGITFENSGYVGSFIVFNAGATNPPLDPTDASNWVARSGEKSLTSFAAVPAAGAGNNDWLISPQISLGISGNTLEFWAKAADATFSEETFSVLVSEFGNSPAEFVELQADLVPQALEWEEFTFNLDAYAGKDVYIAINHTGFDQFGFQVDDFKVAAEVLGANDLVFQGFKYFVANNELSLKANSTMESLSLYNMLGQEVVLQKLNGNNASINLSGLQSGVYIAKVTIEGATKTFKITQN